MKRFYQLLFVVAALVSGTVYGMEEVDIRDYTDVVKHLTTTAGFRADDRFEGRPFEALRSMEEFVMAKGEQKDDSYIQLCVSYLNHCFSASECDADQVERMVRERFTGNSAKALYYAPYKQGIVGYLQLDKLHPAIANACKSKDIDAILDWLVILDGTRHDYETLLSDALGAIIEAKGLTNQMQSWERNCLQKGDNLEGLSKKYIDAFRHKEQAGRNERQQLRANAANRKDQVVGQILNALKAPNQNARLDELLQDELVGDDAPLGEYRDYINAEIQKRMNNSKVKINNREELLNIWNAKFTALPVQVNSQQRLEQQRQAEQQRLQEQIEQQKRQVEEQQRQQLEQQRQVEEEREQKRRQFLEQERAADLEKKKNQEELKQPPIIIDAPVVQPPKIEQPPIIIDVPVVQPPQVELPQQPRSDAPKGIAALFAAITAPKLVFAAVVAGVCYWGYTKYIAYKAAQESDLVDTEKQQKEEAADKQNEQSKSQVRKHQSARKQQPVRRRRG